MSRFTADELIQAIRNATNLSDLKQMVAVDESGSTSEKIDNNVNDGFICRFEDLELVTGDKMQEALHGLKIDDDEEITAMMIIVNDSNTVRERDGGCILIDKDGTCSHYLPEDPDHDQISQATLIECFKVICKQPEAAKEFFSPYISLKLAQYKEAEQ